MKKLASIILVLLMAFCTVAVAEEIDLSAMTEEELVSIIDAARLELTKYIPSVAEGSVLYEDENIKITLNGEMYLEYGSLMVPVVVENYTDMNLIVSFDYASCNGWEIFGGTASVSANKKAKADIDFMNAEVDAELTSVADVQDITCTVGYFDEVTYEFSYDAEEPVTWLFNQ